jgi:hypothetical protein
MISTKTTERDRWWSELREEITKSALSIGCTHVLGYRETASIYEDVIVLNVFGTGCKIKDVSHTRRQNISGKYHRMKTPIEGSPEPTDKMPPMNKAYST